MDRRAADNAYFHRDFHGALSCGIEYLQDHYGETAVREYLREFALTFYAPLRAALQANGLVALKDHFEAIYRLEGGEVQFELSADELVIRVAACPAVQYMRTQGHPVARLYHETTRTINEALCEGSPFVAEQLEYDSQTGRNVQRFSRRLPDECGGRSHP
jgi:hypothetical protein